MPRTADNLKSWSGEQLETKTPKNWNLCNLAQLIAETADNHPLEPLTIKKSWQLEQLKTKTIDN